MGVILPPMILGRLSKRIVVYGMFSKTIHSIFNVKFFLNVKLVWSCGIAFRYETQSEFGSNQMHVLLK